MRISYKTMNALVEELKMVLPGYHFINKTGRILMIEPDSSELLNYLEILKDASRRDKELIYYFRLDETNQTMYLFLQNGRILSFDGQQENLDQSYSLIIRQVRKQIERGGNLIECTVCWDPIKGNAEICQKCHNAVCKECLIGFLNDDDLRRGLRLEIDVQIKCPSCRAVMLEMNPYNMAYNNDKTIKSYSYHAHINEED